MNRHPILLRIAMTVWVPALALLLARVPASRGAASPDSPPPTGRVRDLVADYGADKAKDGEISALLQRAVDDAGAAGGGTVVLPARAGGWALARPVFVGSPDVTIAGQGAGTRLNGGGTLLLLGLKRQYPQAITAGHFPPTAGAAPGNGAPGKETWFDDSVKGPHVGLRTFDGKTRAAGFFPACPFAFGYKVPNDPGGNYWKDYERGAGKPTYWQNWPQYTINLALRNNSPGPIKGVVCGVGAGGPSPQTTRGNIDDPLTVWTVESDPATGNDLCFKFKTADNDGREALRSLLLSKAPAGPGTHRISVQLDFTTGKCRAWYSATPQPPPSPSSPPTPGPSDPDSLRAGAPNGPHPVQPVLASKLDLGEGHRFKAFEYGAFHLGRVTGRMFTGSPSDGATDGDWTYCGLSLLSAPRYAAEGDADQLGAAQQRAADDKPADDAYRFFPASDPALISYLPLTPPPAGGGGAESTSPLLVAYQNGRSYDGAQGFGYWLPQRPPELIPGTIAVRDLQLFAHSSNSGTAIGVGEAARAVIENVYEGGGGYHGVGALPCGPFPDRADRPRLEVHNCTLTARDAALFADDRALKCDNLIGGGGETMFRLVGCVGSVDSVIVTAFVSSDYYVKLHAGRLGGPLRFGQFCIDNEGLSWAPRKACFYAEAPPVVSATDKADPAGDNRLSFPGTLYTGSLSGDKAVIELADAPRATGAAGEAPKSAGILDIDAVDLMASPKKPARCIVLSHSDRWTGAIKLAETRWAASLTHGLIEHDGPGRCGIISYHDDVSRLPDQGTWLEGAHVFRIPGRRDPSTGAWVTKTWRCARGGTYGTPREPVWEQAEKAERQ